MQLWANMPRVLFFACHFVSVLCVQRTHKKPHGTKRNGRMEQAIITPIYMIIQRTHDEYRATHATPHGVIVGTGKTHYEAFLWCFWGVKKAVR